MNDLGLAVDFRQVKESLRQVLDRLDHTDLNEVPELTGLNPTCEVLARHLYRALAKDLNSDRLRVARVRVAETPTTSASYWE